MPVLFFCVLDHGIRSGKRYFFEINMNMFEKVRIIVYNNNNCYE